MIYESFPKLFIFDMDGLLLDSERLYFSILQECMAEAGYRLELPQYCRTLGIAGELLVNTMREMFGPDYPFYEISRQAGERMDTYCAGQPIPVKDGILPLLEFLKDRGVPCCVASSTRRRRVESQLKSAGLHRFFSLFMCGDMVERSKPEPEIFLRCAEHFGVSPEDCVVLEDSENGILAAANGGIPVICIPDLKQPAPEIASHAMFTAKNAWEVLAYYETLSGTVAGA